MKVEWKHRFATDLPIAELSHRFVADAHHRAVDLRQLALNFHMPFDLLHGDYDRFGS
jgi:hypothetical protein